MAFVLTARGEGAWVYRCYWDKGLVEVDGDLDELLHLAWRSAYLLAPGQAERPGRTPSYELGWWGDGDYGEAFNRAVRGGFITRV
jgi:hypothetical protein